MESLLKFSCLFVHSDISLLRTVTLKSLIQIKMYVLCLISKWCQMEIDHVLITPESTICLAKCLKPLKMCIDLPVTVTNSLSLSRTRNYMLCLIIAVLWDLRVNIHRWLFAKLQTKVRCKGCPKCYPSSALQLKVHIFTIHTNWRVSSDHFQCYNFVQKSPIFC